MKRRHGGATKATNNGNRYRKDRTKEQAATNINQKTHLHMNAGAIYKVERNRREKGDEKMMPVI